MASSSSPENSKGKRGYTKFAGIERLIKDEVVSAAYLKGIVYAQRKLANFSNSGLGASVDAEDVVHTAMLKIIDGIRPWDEEKIPDLFIHLAGCIKGEISTVYRSAEHRFIDRSISAEELDFQADEQKTPEQVAELKTIVKSILSYINENREDLTELTNFMYQEETYKPKEIAEKLNISVKLVNTKKFALKRKGTSFLIKHISENHSHLENMATAILDRKIERAKKLACHLGITESEARSQRDELFFILDSIRKGMV